MLKVVRSLVPGMYRPLAHPAVGDLTPPKTPTTAESAVIGMSLTEIKAPGSRSGRIMDSIQFGPCFWHRRMKAASSDARFCLIAPRRGKQTGAEQTPPAEVAGLGARQFRSTERCRLIA
jgi:hypothetical protein